MEDQTFGIIDNCGEACVHEDASSSSDVLTTLKQGSEVIVDLYSSTDDFYMIYTKYGLGGFCAKNFITRREGS